MKNILFYIVISVTTLTACNSNNHKSGDGHDHDHMAMDTATVKEPAGTINDSVLLKEIVNGYLQIKNALATDDTKYAAEAGTALDVSFKNFDKSSLTAEQMKIFEDVEADAREHAEHIGGNSGKIAHQRQHFEILSKDMVDLLNVFGSGGQTLYKDFCPMYNNNKGAYWISESKEIKNPFYGKAMSTCGTVKEEIK